MSEHKAGSGDLSESIGAKRVRVDFNPAQDDHVKKLKQGFARLINDCQGISNGQDGEVNRCVSLAMTHLETAAMYAVKAATAHL